MILFLIHTFYNHRGSISQIFKNFLRILWRLEIYSEIQKVLQSIHNPTITSALITPNGRKFPHNKRSAQEIRDEGTNIQGMNSNTVFYMSTHVIPVLMKKQVNSYIKFKNHLRIIFSRLKNIKLIKSICYVKQLAEPSTWCHVLKSMQDFQSYNTWAFQGSVT